MKVRISAGLQVVLFASIEQVWQVKRPCWLTLVFHPTSKTSSYSPPLFSFTAPFYLLSLLASLSPPPLLLCTISSPSILPFSHTPLPLFTRLPPLHLVFFSQPLLFFISQLFSDLPPNPAPPLDPPSEPCRLAVSCWPASPTSSSSAADWLRVTWLSSSSVQRLLFIGLADPIEPAPPSSSLSLCLVSFFREKLRSLVVLMRSHASLHENKEWIHGWSSES